MARVNLTEGVLLKWCQEIDELGESGSAWTTNERPTSQVLRIENKGDDSYIMQVSDGIFSHKHFWLSSDLAHMVKNKRLIRFSIIEITNVTYLAEPNQKTFFLEGLTLKSSGERQAMIGEPIELNSNGTIPRSKDIKSNLASNSSSSSVSTVTIDDDIIPFTRREQKQSSRTVDPNPILIDEPDVFADDEIQVTSTSTRNSGSTSSTRNQTTNSSNKGSGLDPGVSFCDPDVLIDDDYDLQLYIATERSNKSMKSSRPQPLIPENIIDETLASINFYDEFRKRYGDKGPTFFQGSIKDAMQESFSTPKVKDRKMLAVYFHHDMSILTQIFCSNRLCKQAVSDFVNEHFISFGWDLTFNSNKIRGIDMIQQHFGRDPASKIHAMKTDKMPLLILAYKLRSTPEVFDIIEGNVTVDELMAKLIVAQENYQAQLAVAVHEEEERLNREAMRQEQDQALREAELADQAKEAAKRREEEERIERENIEAAIRDSEEMERQRAEREKDEKCAEIKATLPDEPKEEKEEGKEVSKLRFMLPRDKPVDGKGTLDRRFLASEKVQVVINYLAAKGFPASDYKVLSSYPRRDITEINQSLTLKDLKLYPQEKFNVEER